MLVYIMKQPAMLGNPEVEAEGPYSVVLAPTRELAQQVCYPAQCCAELGWCMRAQPLGADSRRMSSASPLFPWLTQKR